MVPKVPIEVDINLFLMITGFLHEMRQIVFVNKNNKIY